MEKFYPGTRRVMGMFRPARAVATITLLAIILFSAMLPQNGFAQCTGGSASQYPGGSISVGTGNTVTIATDNYEGDWTDLTGFVPSASYTISISNPTDYITVRSGSYLGAVIAFGPTPLTFTAPVLPGDLFVTYSCDNACSLACTSFTSPGDDRLTQIVAVPAITGAPADACIGSSITLTGTNLSGVTQVTFDGSGTSVAPSSVTATSVTVTVPAGATTGTITVTAPGGTATSSSVTINPLPAATVVSGGGTFCGSTTINANNGGDGTMYFEGTTSGGTSTTTPATSEVISTSGTYYFRAQSASGCWGPEGSATVNINSNLPVSVTIAANPGITVCNGTSVTFTATPTNEGSSPTYQWLVNGLNVGANSPTYTSNSLANGDVVTCVLTSSEPCATGSPATSNALTMTVTLSNTFNLTSGAGTDAQTVCINSAITDITYTTGSATGISNDGVSGANGLPAGVSAHWAANTITISGTPTASGTFNYSIPLTGGCGTVNVTGTITVTAANTAGVPSSNPTVCINTAIPAVTINTTGATGISNDGVSGANGLPAGVSASWSANTITITGTPTVSGTFTYNIPLTGGCGAINATGTITVTDINTAGAPSSTPTLCINTAIAPAITISTTGATGISNDGVSGANGLPAGVSATWSANTITITGTPTASGTFTYSIPLTGGCGAVNATGTITVTVNNTAGAPSSTPTLCINSALTAITISTSGATGISNDGVSGANGLPAGVSATWSANTITISGTPTAAGTFNYSIPLTGGCGAINATGTITVTANNTAGAPSSTPTVCINTALTAITINTTGATGISNDGVSGANGLPAGVSATWSANTITISGTPTAAGTFNYSIPMTGGCGAVNATGTITVTIANTAGAPSSTPTLCINTALTPITINTNGATGISNDGVSGANGLPAGVSAHWAAGTITISGTPTASGTFNYSIPLTGGCGGGSASGTITVTPTNTAGAPSSTPTLCISTVLTPITITTTGATGISNDGVGGANGLPAGVSAHWAAGTITISGTPTASGTFNYSILMTGGCGAVNAIGTITVTANNTAGAPSSTPTLCINTILTAITINTTGATGISNDGVTGVNGLPAGVSAHWAAGTITISGTPSASGTFNYSIPMTGGCGAVNATGTITVKANNTAGAPSSTPTLCINTVLTAITINTTGATAISNDGVSGANGLPAGVSAHWAGGTITISGTPTASGTFNYSIPMTGGCGAVNATGTITVTPKNTAGAPSSTPTLCISTALTPITISTTGATGISNDGVPGVNGLPGGVSAHWAAGTITISGTPTASGTFNYSIPMTGGCGAVNATGTITVTANNTAGAPSSTPTLCINTALTAITINTTGATAISNDGVSGANGLPAGVSAHWAAGKITITGTPTASGTFNYSIPMTGGCGAINATGTITVTANNTAGAPSSTPTLCINTALTAITINTTGATGIGAATGLPTGVTAAWAANKITISGTPSVAGTFNYSIPLSGGCGSVNATGTITVTPNNTINLTSAAGTNAQTICFGSSITNITYSTTGATGATFSGLPGGVTGVWAANVVTISGTPTASGAFSYTVTLTGGCGSVTATGTIMVNTPPATTGVTICQGGSGSLTSSAGCASATTGTAGPNFAGTGANSGGGGTAWTAPGNVNANDNAYATVTGRGTGFSQGLLATNFAFAIPGTATITGITVTISRFENTTGGGADIQDNTVRLLYAGAAVGTNMGATATNWPTAEATANYGASNNLWGATWTPAQINSGTFGVELYVDNTSFGTNRTANVDYITITVSYSIPGTLNWYTVSSGGSAIGNGTPFNPVGVAGSGLPNTNTPGTYTFYAECTAAAPGCRTATPFVINPTPTITGTTTICNGSTTQLTGSGTKANTNPWLSSVTGVATVDNNGLVTAHGAGTTTITYTDNNGCGATTTVTVNANTSISGQPSNSAICQGSNTSFTVTAAGTSLTCHW